MVAATQSGALKGVTYDAKSNSVQIKVHDVLTITVTLKHQSAAEQEFDALFALA